VDELAKLNHRFTPPLRRGLRDARRSWRNRYANSYCQFSKKESLYGGSEILSPPISLTDRREGM